MFKNQYLIKSFLIICALLLATNFSCSSDDSAQDIQVRVNGNVVFEEGDDFNGDVDGDFTGNDGSGERTFLWLNSLSTADYNADITETSNGVFSMEVKDADNNIVLNRSLRGGTEPDSFSGVTSSGTPGIWSVSIKLTSFTGDGSFSLSEGD